MRNWLAVMLFLAAIAWAFSGPSPPRPVVTAPAFSVAEASPRVVAPIAAPSVFEVLHTRRLADALTRFEAAASPQALQRLRTEVDAACRVPLLLQLDNRREPDPRRDPARTELERRCAALPVPSMWVTDGDTMLPNEAPADAELGAAALLALRHAADPDALKDAWLEAFRQDALPQDQIFPDHRRLLPAEAEALIQVVIDWRECTRLNACGSDSLLTLRVCAQHGCAAVSDLRAAWHGALAPRDYESALAIHAWLLRWQAAGRP